MVKFLTKAITWFLVYALVYFLLTWILLGMGPKETYQKMSSQLRSYVVGTTDFFRNFTSASTRLAQKANKHGIQEAKIRYEGRDYYDDYNQNVDSKVRQDFGR